jgi:hypothetical protein
MYSSKKKPTLADLFAKVESGPLIKKMTNTAKAQLDKPYVKSAMRFVGPFALDEIKYAVRGLIRNYNR